MKQKMEKNMNMFKYGAAVLAMAICGLGFADSEFDSGKAVTVKDMGGNLSMSGEVGVEYLFGSLTKNDIKQIGANSATGNGNSQFDVDFKLVLDYRTDNSWARAKIRSDNNMGENDGANFHTDTESSGFRLKECFYGMNLMEDGASSLTMELGREQMNNVYSSGIQFDRRTKHDGLIFNYKNSFENLGVLDVVASGFMIDEKHDHFGWGLQANLAEVMDSGLNVRYSYVSWENKRGANETNDTMSRNSEVSLGYNLDPELLGVETMVGGGWVINHAAKKNSTQTVNSIDTGEKRENTAWYVNLDFGKVENEGDWEVKAQYETVAQNAILDNDVAGIGRYMGLGANYKGYTISGSYGVCDNLTAAMTYSDADTDNTNFGDNYDVTRFELELTYSF
jgi:hypothetical protein